ncbi:hypothetical protein J6590_088867 [Homalodisca vitripennis]|nr:hypothetical protein J6590_088867 [Homalodisca vitripennis]
MRIIAPIYKTYHTSLSKSFSGKKSDIYLSVVLWLNNTHGCWLSVLCVNLWVVFSKPLRPRVQTSAHWWLYTLYSVLGWGIPLLFCFLLAAVGVVPGKSDSCPKPSFTTDACFFNEMRTTQLFLHFPTMFMLQINFLMFVSMLFHMQSHFQQTAGVSRESSHRHNSWLSVLCVNLWVVFSKPLRPRVQSSAHWWLYTLYSVLGWGIPLLFCFLIAAVGVVPGKSDSCPKPSFTIDACFFNEMRTTQLFLHFPTMFMLQINFLMFVSMLFHMQSHFQQTAGVSRESSHRHNRSDRLRYDT